MDTFGDMKKINKHNIVEHLITYQLKMIDKDFSATEEEGWYSKNKITQEQHNEFEAYATRLIQKVYRCSKAIAKKEFMAFDLCYGLSIKDSEAN